MFFIAGKMNKLAIILVLAGVASGCALTNDENSQAEWTALPGSWHEDYTLREGDVEAFVPTSVDVPISRFIEVMTFEPDGSFSIFRLAPNDAHYWAYGTWTRSDNIITVNFSDNGNIQEQYEVVELTSSIFRFRRI